jgi:hypothetical protein
MSSSTDPSRGTARRLLAFSGALFLAIAAAIVPASAASAADVFVFVNDQHGNPVQWLDVVVEEVASGNTSTENTGPTGALALTGLNDGDYTVAPVGTADMNGRFYAAAAQTFSTSGPTATVVFERLGQISGHLVDQYGNDVVGMQVEIYNGSGSYLVETDPVNGTFTVSVPAIGAQWFYYVDPAQRDNLGYGYVSASAGAFLDTVTETYDFGDIELDRYENIAGTITNFDAATMSSVRVFVDFRAAGGTSWVQLTSEETLDGTFSIPAILGLGTYALYFEIDYSAHVPFLDAYLGGSLDRDASDLIEIEDVADVAPVVVNMTLPDAAVISGHVTDAQTGDPVPGIYVSVTDQPDQNVGDEWLTDADGYYELYVVPGLTYAVYADDYDGVGPYDSMTYDGLSGCGCVYTPVQPTVVDPADGIDFALGEGSDSYGIGGYVLDDAAGPLDGIRVDLYSPTGDGWSLVDAVVTPDAFGGTGTFLFMRDLAGDFRLQFRDIATGRLLEVVDGGYLPTTGSPVTFDPVPACYADLGTVSEDLLVVALIDPATPSGTCSALPGPSGGGGGSPGSGTPRIPKTTAAAAVAEPTPTPTPSATPTPKPSTDPEPTATPAPEPTPASALDLSWLVWVLLAMLAVLVIGVVVFFVRRA